MSLSSRAAFQAAVYGVEQHILCEKKCRYKPLPLPDTEEHILHSPVKILKLFIQPLGAHCLCLSEYLCGSYKTCS